MKIILRFLVLAITLLSFSSCSKSDNDELSVLAKSEVTNGKWKLIKGKGTYEGDVDTFTADNENYLIFGKDGKLIYEEHRHYHPNGVRVTNGDYDLNAKYYRLQDVDYPERYDRYEILELTRDNLHVKVTFKPNDVLELWYNKVQK